MRGRGGDPRRVVDQNRFANQFSSQQPSIGDGGGAVTPITAAPSSPMAGVGNVATVPATSAPARVTAPSPTGMGDIGDTASQSIAAAATPTYGIMSQGAITSSNKLGT